MDIDTALYFAFNAKSSLDDGTAFLCRGYHVFTRANITFVDVRNLLHNCKVVFYHHSSLQLVLFVEKCYISGLNCMLSLIDRE